jgi:hypothetical protein
MFKAIKKILKIMVILLIKINLANNKKGSILLFANKIIPLKINNIKFKSQEKIRMKISII